jgi:hypothetical protein
MFAVEFLNCNYYIAVLYFVKFNKQNLLLNYFLLLILIGPIFLNLTIQLNVEKIFDKLIWEKKLLSFSPLPEYKYSGKAKWQTEKSKSQWEEKKNEIQFIYKKNTAKKKLKRRSI